ncbi:GPP34 family phosphoprotein [Streptomyces sp. NPDC049577]|uniref:GOLPH3/VPS74 family protein n=1 Tax=Streptomyces sp. NPDC049577 TaxID=3155153 RepID=UPI0034237651
MNAEPDGRLALPEELLLLSLHPETGRKLCRTRFLQYGVAGAVLAELALGGHVAEERGRLVIADPMPPADPLLAAVLAGLSGKGAKGPRTRTWVRQAGRHMEERWLKRLIGRGALRMETRRFLGVVPYHRYPAAGAGHTAPARQRLDEALRAGFPDPRSRALAALVAAIDVHNRLYPGLRARGLRRTLRRLVRVEWPAHAVYDNVRRDKASESSGG